MSGTCVEQISLLFPHQAIFESFRVNDIVIENCVYSIISHLSSHLSHLDPRALMNSVLNGMEIALT